MDLDTFIERQIESRPIEARIVRRIVKALRQAGTPVTAVFDGDETVEVDRVHEVFRQVFNLDEALLITEAGAWVRLVMGQDWDILVDYSVDLDGALTPVNDYIDKNM